MNTIEQAREAARKLRDDYVGNMNLFEEGADTIDALIAELEIANSLVKARLSNSAAATQQEPVGHLTLDGDFIQNQRWVMQFGIVPRGKPLYLAAGAQPYKDSTTALSVGDSAFESWFASYTSVSSSLKQLARDAYAAGMGDPLVVAAGAQSIPGGYALLPKSVIKMTLNCLCTPEQADLRLVLRDLNKAMLAAAKEQS